MSSEPPPKKDQRSANADNQRTGGIVGAFSLIGPVAAGFNVATYVLGFVGAGALSNWVIERWFPFTRWVWSQVLQLITLPDISNADKDALTTVVFFLPLGIWAIIFGRSQSKYYRGRNENYMRAAGALTGAVFLLIVGNKFLINIFGVILTIYERGGVNPFIIWAIISSAAYIMISFALHQIKMSKIEAGILHEVADHRYSRVAYSFSILIGSVVFLILATGGAFFIGLVGSIQSISLFVTLALGAITSIRTPYRMMMALGVVLCFVSAGLVFEVGVGIIDYIDSVTTEGASIASTGTI